VAISTPALEKGTIDAAEFVGPYDDSKLGFNKVAPFYYYPGWWEGGVALMNLINLDKWNELPDAYKGVLKNASALANSVMMARYDTLNPIALKKLVFRSTKLRPYSLEILEACFAANKVLCGNQRRERTVQEAPRFLHGLSRRRLPLVPAG
jgi:TRAP-type mannitol/chloroaromatic compound transport system substrate-binding protein